jgi:hypothetical protein
MKGNKNTFRPSVEALEAREVPAFTGGFSGGVLTINGTGGNDSITLRQSGNAISLDGYTNRWDASQISSIRINAGAGDDTVTLNTSQQVAGRLRADGGSGYDKLYTTAQPTSWTNFQVGKLISPPSGSSGGSGTQQNTAGVHIVRTGNTGPYTVSYYRRGSPNTGELKGTYNTLAEANQAVNGLLKWAAEIKASNAYYGVVNGYWEIAKITVEGSNSGSGSGSGTGTTPSSGQVRYNGYTVSDGHVRWVLGRIAQLFGRDVIVTSGDRGHVPQGGSSTSLHLHHRAVDFYISGLSVPQSASLIYQYRSYIFQRGQAYEFILHGAYTATGGSHLHLGHYPPGRASAISWKHEGTTSTTRGHYSVWQISF